MLEPTQVIAYVTALTVAAAIPGPGITALIARSVNSGALAGFSMLVGLVLGDLTYLSFAVFGLAVLAKTFSVLFVVVKWGAVAYLCYLAWLFWTADHESVDGVSTSKRRDLFSAALSGYTVTLANPKTIAFYLALLPVIINLESITIQNWAFMLVPLTTLVLIGIGSTCILGAIGIRRLLSSQKAQKLLHRGAATTMMMAAGSMIAKEVF